MKQFLLLALLLASVHYSPAQHKKPLDHSVYDSWKSIGERLISNNGRYIVYTVNVQEGDGELVIQNAATGYKKTIPRGYSAAISNDSRHLFFRIRPFFQEVRQARIKKRRADEMPKDSLGIVELGQDSIIKIARVKSFKLPPKGSGWIAIQLEKPLPDSTRKKSVNDSGNLQAEMLARLADSVIRRSVEAMGDKLDKEGLIAMAQKAAREILQKPGDNALPGTIDQGVKAGADLLPTKPVYEGSDLVIRTPDGCQQQTFKWVEEFHFDNKGNMLLIETSRSAKDSSARSAVLVHHLLTGSTDTILNRCNDCRNYAMDEKGEQLAFLAETDSSSRSLQKFYKLYYYRRGQDSAVVIAHKATEGMQDGYGISENGSPRFSKDGSRIYFGIAPIRPPKDTMLVDFELARLDVWHYNDDYLQTRQLRELGPELRRSYLAVTIPGSGKIVPLGDRWAENIALADEGNADYVLASTTMGNRIATQWTGRTKQSAYLIDVKTGSRKLIKENSPVSMKPSPGAKFIYWYDPALKHYFTYNVSTGVTKNVTEHIPVPLYDTENDVPDDADPAGVTGWTDNDADLLVNDEYDIWQVDPDGIQPPLNITNGFGRKQHISFTRIQFSREQRWIGAKDQLILRSFNRMDKTSGFFTTNTGEKKDPSRLITGPYNFSVPLKADSAAEYVLQRSDITASELLASSDLKQLSQLTDLASQQKDYNWLSVELVKWRMFDGRMSEGLLYKPADFDPLKKYPVILCFYERNANGLYQYKAPAPSASTINVPYFVSNGYLVFDPNIYYKEGEPGESAYNSVVSAASYLSKMPWVDSSRMGLQGQSWGGYQVAYLITRTNMFKAAGAGAPVANMTSAYGGIRWGSGMNRQFQYEKAQSRIGASLWQRPDLYTKNSPLFAADKITTPLLITHNDADDAVPWSQGIELFTAMRRLDKKVWMLQYNGEAHNLVERKNRKDLSVRLEQFFNYYLKDARPARWIKEGLPATEKGTTWGLEVN